MGGSQQQPQQPTPPPAPTATQTAEDYAKAMPIYYETALKYNPLMAQQEKAINEQLYPSTAGLQEIIAGQANQALTGGVPDWYNREVRDTLASNFGRNMVYNPQGQEAFGIATQQAYKDYQDYYRNLALTAAGRQPLAQSPNIMQSYTPQANMSFAQQGYGTGAQIYGTQANMYNNQQQLNAQYGNPWANIGGSIAGGIGSGLGTGVGMWAMNKWGPK